MANVPAIPFSTSPTSDQCMYSGLPLDESDEHVLIDSLGSSLSSESMICSRFNHLSASKLDSALFAPYRLVTHQLGVKGKKGLRTHNFRDDEGRVFSVGADQQPQMKLEVDLGQAQNGKRQVRLAGSDFGQMKKVLKTIVSKGRLSTALENGELSAVEGDRPTIVEEAVFGGVLYSAALKKTLLSLIAYFDGDLARSMCFVESRKAVFDACVLPSAVDDTIAFGRINGKVVSEQIPLPILSPLDHQIVITFSHETGQVTGSVRLFSSFDHGFLLSNSYNGPDRTLYYCRDPLGSSSSSTTFCDRPEYTTSLAVLTEGSWSNLNGAMNNLLPHMQLRATQQAIESVPDSALPEWQFPNGSHLSDVSKLQEAAFRMGTKLMRMLAENRKFSEKELESVCGNLSKSMAQETAKEVGTQILNEELRECVAVTWYSLWAEHLMESLRS